LKKKRPRSATPMPEPEIPWSAEVLGWRNHFMVATAPHFRRDNSK